MKLPKPAVLCLLFIACAAGGGAATVDLPTNERLKEAQRALDTGDPDAALTITDELLKAQPDLVQARMIAARGNMVLAGLERRGLDTRLVLQDAARHYQHVIDLGGDVGRAYHGLADARYQLSDFEGARTAAAEAVRLLQTEERPDLDAVAAALILAARCDLQDLIAARQAEMADAPPDSGGPVRPSRDSLELANAALTKLEAAQRMRPAEAFQLGALVYQWIGQNDNALLDLERGIRSAPDATELHEAYLTLHVNLGQARALAVAYARFARDYPNRPLMQWFHGRALVALADELRGRSEFISAAENYRKAGEAFAAYGSAVPAHHSAAQQWVAICELSNARVAIDSGDVDGARQHLFAAAAASPMTTEYDGLVPTLMDSFRSHFAGVVFAISRTLSESGDDPLTATLAFNEEILDKWPGKWGFVYNNAALPARDLGVRLTQDLEDMPEAERKTALATAMDLWERSYRYYEEAVKLSPDDPRIVNDCGLMLIYHLGRDFDRARECFEKAIEVGQPQLDALGADAPLADRQFLEEAIGDAWQNLAVLSSRHLREPFAKWEGFCKKAVEFYPYKRREAWHMLQEAGGDPSGAAVRGGSTGAPAGVAAAQVGQRTRGPKDPLAAQGNKQEQFDEARREVEGKLADDDLDGALAALDKAAKQLKGFAPFHHLRGDISLRYAIAARDSGRTDVEFLFQDAVRELGQAVELDAEPNAPRQLLARAQYESGQLREAASTASALLLHMQSQGGGDRELLDAVHEVRANAAARVYVQDKSAAGADQMLADARVSFRQLEERGKLDEKLRATWSATEATAGSVTEAVGVFARALQKSPDDMALLGSVVDTAANLGEARVAVDALQARTDAAGLWFLGKARYYQGAELRAATDNKQAIEVLQGARQAFEQSKQKNADYAPSCDQWIAVCLGKMGNAALTEARLDEAERWLLEALEMQPQRITDDLGLGDSTKRGVMLVADRYRQSDLPRTEAIYRRAVKAADQDLDLLNNAGLFSRDVGEGLARSGKRDEATDFFEASYAAYSKAVRLDPGNVRLRNDCALLAVHWLERDWELSRQMLDDAIRDGDQQLADWSGLPEDRNQLEEAVGDCYENLALWHLKHSDDFAAAKAAAQKSMEFRPGQSRPGATRHLREAERRLKDK